MKRPKAPTRDRVRDEGLTQAELAAVIRRRAYELYEQRGRAEWPCVRRLVTSGSRLGQAERSLGILSEPPLVRGANPHPLAQTRSRDSH